MQKLLIVGNSQQYIKIIESELAGLAEDMPQLRVHAVRPIDLGKMLDSVVQTLVLDTQIINKKVYPFIVQVRKLGYGGPIVILGNPRSSFDMQELTSISNVYHMHKPYEVAQLQGLIKNCINLGGLRQRRDQRFDVREQATLEAYSSDFAAETTINNISRSGVRIEGVLDGLKKGDLLRLHFNFDKINKERTMSARVVWVKKEGDNKEEAGLEFVSQKDVYQYLLNYAIA